MTSLAAIDCGTNSVRLLVAEAVDGTLVERAREVRLTRLGQGVDATGAFHPDALGRTFAVCEEYAGIIAEHQVSRLRFVATSAARDAGNRDAFFGGVRERLGVEAEIIPGAEEAELSFTGALTVNPQAATPALVMDIGGGSTELVLGRPGQLDQAVSLDIGSVRLRERFLHADPPTLQQVAEATAYVDELLDASGVDIASARTWFGVGGTATSLAAMLQRLATYDRATVHGSTITRGQLSGVAEELLVTTAADILASYPTMVPGRADVICCGALIAARVARRAQVDLTVSEADILDGLVLGLAHA